MNSLKKHFLPIAMATMLTACATEQQSTNITNQESPKTPEASVQQAQGISPRNSSNASFATCLSNMIYSVLRRSFRQPLP